MENCMGKDMLLRVNRNYFPSCLFRKDANSIGTELGFFMTILLVSSELILVQTLRGFDDLGRT